MPIKRQKNRILKYISDQDIKPSSLALSFGGAKEYRSRTGGCISLILITCVIAIFCIKLSGVIWRNNLTTRTNVLREDLSAIDLSNLNPRLYFSIGHKVGEHLLCSEAYSYGINITITINYIFRQNNQTKQNTTTLENLECENDRYFVLPKDLNSTILGSVDFLLPDEGKDEEIYRRIGFRVTKCSKTANSQCQQYNQHLFPYLSFRNHQININSHDEANIVREETKLRGFQTLTPLLTNNLIQFNLFFTKVNIITDSSVWPSFLDELFGSEVRQISTWLYDEEKEVLNAQSGEEKDLEMLTFFFKRSIYTYEYRRSFDRLDDALSSAFGMAGLFYLVHGLLYSGYNQWSYKQLRMRQMGVPGVVKPNLLIFYWVSLKWFIWRVFSICRLAENEQNQEEIQNQQQYLDFLRYIKKTDKDCEQFIRIIGFRVHKCNQSKLQYHQYSQTYFLTQNLGLNLNHLKGWTENRLNFYLQAVQTTQNEGNGSPYFTSPTSTFFERFQNFQKDNLQQK